MCRIDWGIVVMPRYQKRRGLHRRTLNSKAILLVERQILPVERLYRVFKPKVVPMQRTQDMGVRREQNARVCKGGTVKVVIGFVKRS